MSELNGTIELLAKHGVSTNGIILNQEPLKNDKRYQYYYKREAALAS